MPRLPNHRVTSALWAALILAAPAGAIAAPEGAGEAGAAAPAAGEVRRAAVPGEAAEAPSVVDAGEEEAEAVEAEMAAMRAMEAAAIGGDLVDLDRALRLLGAANPWRSRIRSSFHLDAGTWPSLLEAAETDRLREPGQLPFPLESVASKYDIPLAYNEAVADYLAFFQGPGRRFFTVWLERSGRWIPLFREILREHGVPEDLVYLAMIESGFSMHARSWAAAVGPWQFIEGTGRQYGLRTDFWVDERRDPIKATHAAARFLKRLHETWGDWYLAWAGYNAGPARVQKAIEKHGTRDFWELAATDDAFRKETRHYVPKLIAAALIAKHPRHFGFGEIAYHEPLAWETVEIPDATDLEVIARCAGTTVEEIQLLNPELRRWATPPVGPRGEPYLLRLPAGTRVRFAENFANVKPHERFTFRSYKVRPGDTIGAIALAFDTSAAEVMRANRIADPRRLRIGQELIIPVPPDAGPRTDVVRHARASSSRRAVAAAPAGAVWHTVQAGETLGHVALRYGCSVEDLKRWNGIRDVRRVRVGQKLRVR